MVHRTKLAMLPESSVEAGVLSEVSASAIAAATTVDVRSARTRASQTSAPVAAASASARENRRRMQKGVVVDLLNEEIRHVGPRDEPACPAARIDQRAIGVRLRPIGEDHWTHDHPIELAVADDAFLHVLVVIDAPQQQMKRDAVKKSAMAAAVAGPEARLRGAPAIPDRPRWRARARQYAARARPAAPAPRSATLLRCRGA